MDGTDSQPPVDRNVDAESREPHEELFDPARVVYGRIEGSADRPALEFRFPLALTKAFADEINAQCRASGAEDLFIPWSAVRTDRLLSRPPKRTSRVAGAITAIMLHRR